MNICVLTKQVPDTDSSIRINDLSDDIVLDGLKMIMNPYDEYAVEEAVKTCQSIPGSKSTVMTLGEGSSKSILITSLAMGMDEAVRIEDPGGEEDCYKTAIILSRVLGEMDFDLIFVGKSAFDDNASSVGALVAEFLGVPYVSNVVKFEITGDDSLKIHREKESGADVVCVSLPCVISCEKGLNRPRYPKLMKLMKANKKNIPVRSIDSLGFTDVEINGFEKTKTLGLITPPCRPPGKMLEGEPEEVISELFRELREVVKVV
ncbi:MAG: electron transfer flavoprotein subunit beta/FixA family protein [Candidatus Eremiobacteraeota bacterium]|nr:electron transfer flavoprotein subunit beta/FixA family protein [Candidatus Eremiobacteraeota bacterium]